MRSWGVEGRGADWGGPPSSIRVGQNKGRRAGAQGFLQDEGRKILGVEE